ncbi:Gfo/Idh/MocA family oxidoreductase [Bacillus sp. CMF21]|uniref:Gfo/Idh/MocA family protein n=1 Tax=Metabacillus dongyingensis TaxID=2874282 RepID=UPI001CBCD900|nr:Gfo/Idh/MocA family oxidoreductase [Metabacillus dongyingensis]UAL51503.1 Gfo/Idh/MocA family oxidoreductase [Metabacillus dongyingensis]USK27806.1 Gfo/Idh/MocA family oxidoreductase [Bacillus sp. CMF21]
MRKVKIGVIGTGSISDAHLQSYEQNDRADLTSVCDLNEERARLKAKKYGASKVYTDYRELLHDDEIDAVSICTWNNTHAEIAIAALENGKHVLVEKPLSKTLDEALKVKQAVENSGKILQVGFVRRYDNNIHTLKKFIENGDLGDIYYAKASSLRRLGNPGGWFSDKDISGGGPLLDVGVHIIDLCWYLMGRPKVKSISGNTYSQLGNRSNIKNLSFYKAADYDPAKNTVEDLANAIIRFENGASLVVDVCYTLHAQKDESIIKLYGDKGGAEIDPEFKIITEKYNTILNITPQVDSAGFDFASGFQNEIDCFISSCLGEAVPLSSVDDGVEMMKILTAIYESSQKGIEIQFDKGKVQI